MFDSFFKEIDVTDEIDDMYESSADILTLDKLYLENALRHEGFDFNELFNDDWLMHIGTDPASGRYKEGSGKNPYQHESHAFMKAVTEYRALGMSNKEIAKALNYSSENELRKAISRHTNNISYEKTKAIRELYESGITNKSDIARRVGMSEGAVRKILNADAQSRTELVNDTANALKNAVGDKKYIDVGEGVNYQLGITEHSLNTAIEKLIKEEGYQLITYKERELGKDTATPMKVLIGPGETKEDFFANHKYDVRQIVDREGDTSVNGRGMITPVQISKDRVLIRYAEEGGLEKDGLIELRRGVPDLSLGGDVYSQVRIGVEGDKYLKGMAVYGDIPEGYDIVFNTNKKLGTDFNKVLKDYKPDPENPFGTTIKSLEEGGQSYYDAPDGTRQLSAINKVNKYGDWDDWQSSLSRQFLSKQLPELADRQLKLAEDIKRSKLDDICSIKNDTLKEYLLWEYSDSMDSDAADLKAAPMARQSTKVILPVPSLKDGEVYAPGYKDGETVVLIRFPHAGRMEIPELTVNNRNAEGIKMIGKQPLDAIGINSKTAAQLSGADFDGDTCLIIPNNDRSIKTRPAIKELVEFDAKGQYKIPDGDTTTPRMKNTQIEMGKISNLIVDMQLQDAPIEHVVRAIKHSMVVIDAEKHGLDYKASERDNQIAELRKTYQGSKTGGAATLISRSTKEIDVDKEKNQSGIKTAINKETGEYIVKKTGDKKYKLVKDKDGNPVLDENGKKVYVENGLKQQKKSMMSTVSDAFEITSGGKNNPSYPMEVVYAKHANARKALANTARKIILTLKPEPVDKTAAKKYEAEVKSLDAKLINAKANGPYERSAKIYANMRVKAAMASSPTKLSEKEIKKIRGQALTAGRKRFGAGKEKIYITDKEWEAIENHAISSTKAKEIFRNTDKDQLMNLALPKERRTITPAKESAIRAMAANDVPLYDIATELGLSQSAISSVLNK